MWVHLNSFSVQCCALKGVLELNVLADQDKISIIAIFASQVVFVRRL